MTVKFTVVREERTTKTIVINVEVGEARRGTLPTTSDAHAELARQLAVKAFNKVDETRVEVDHTVLWDDVYVGDFGGGAELPDEATIHLDYYD